MDVLQGNQKPIKCRINLQKTEPHITPLDGLRGLAILLVLLGHYFQRFYLPKIGWIGLNLFFLLSGYLITSRLFHHANEGIRKYFTNFYGRRILRIFPLYYGCLIFFLFILPIFYVNYIRYFSGLQDIQIWYWLYISNWLYILKGIPNVPLFFHFWSLAVEEQFYLIWPFIFILTAASKRKLIILIIISISILTRLIVSAHGAYYNTLTACEPLQLGCLLCVIEKEGTLIRYKKLLFAFAVFSLLGLLTILSLNSDLHTSNTGLLRYGYTGIDLLLLFLLYTNIIGGKSSQAVQRFFSMKWICWLGKYSYGIYVFHWLILQLFINRYDIRWVDGRQNIFAYFVIRLAAIIMLFVCSYLSYTLFEKRFLGLKKYFI